MHHEIMSSVLDKVSKRLNRGSQPEGLRNYQKESWASLGFMQEKYSRYICMSYLVNTILKT